jgi:hypothetical protein
MKLRTIKELINGRYVNIDFDETYAGKNMNRLNFTYILVYVAYLILKMPDRLTELALKQATIGAGICMLLVIITGIFGLYFALCETYIGDCTND